MSAIVTDQFRILNASNFVDSVQDSSNSYYVFVGLSNPQGSGFGRSAAWDTNTPDPTDNLDYSNHYQSTILYGKKVTSANIRRVIRKIDWVSGQKYEMYRPDYSIINPSPLTSSMRLYDANYYAINSDYRVYICIDNGSSGINTTGNSSQIEPTFTDLEPSKLGDGYVWKYLYTISPSDVIKFDSTEYITVPNAWETSADPQISTIRDNGNSALNENQIKKVYIKNGGSGYTLSTGQPCNILGDGSGGSVSLEVNSATGSITDVIVTSGGKNYTYGLIDLGTTSTNTPSVYAELIPIIPPSKGHGFNIYAELGADKVLVYARFDDTSKQFPVDTKFAQVGILKNPTVYDSTGISTNLYTSNDFSGVYSIRFSNISGTISVGDKIRQSVSGGTAYGNVISYDSETMVLKYSQDRSLYYSGGGGIGHTDFVGMSSFFSENNTVLPFSAYNPSNPSETQPIIKIGGGFNGTVSSFTGITTTISNKIINLGVYYTNGLANPEINSKSGDIIYIDNRPTVSRSSRQKEDFKIILEF
jgi:hypothetical protein